MFGFTLNLCHITGLKVLYQFVFVACLHSYMLKQHHQVVITGISSFGTLDAQHILSFTNPCQNISTDSLNKQKWKDCS